MKLSLELKAESLKPRGEGLKQKQSGFVHLGLILAVVSIAAVGFVGWRVWSEQKDKSLGTSSKSESAPSGEKCQNKVPLFSANFIELDKIDALGPLGGVGGGSPGRSYMGVKVGQETAVYNPTKSTLETIVYARRGGPSTPGEYGLYFRLGCVLYLFDHLDRLSDEIKALAPKEPSDSSATQFGSQPNKVINAGQLLGYSNGTPLARTFDFLVEDESKKAYHINEKRWDWKQAVDSVCPYDLFSDELKAKYYQKIGEYSDSGFIKAESCGGPSQDVDGTASGGWFQGDSTTTKGKWLAIGKQFGRAELAIRETSNFLTSLKDYNPKILPDKLTPGNQVCYKGYSNNWAYLSLISKTQLKLATGTGACPGSFPDAKAETWER